MDLKQDSIVPEETASVKNDSEMGAETWLEEQLTEPTDGNAEGVALNAEISGSEIPAAEISGSEIPAAETMRATDSPDAKPGPEQKKRLLKMFEDADGLQELTEEEILPQIGTKNSSMTYLNEKKIDCIPKITLTSPATDGCRSGSLSSAPVFLAELEDNLAIDGEAKQIIDPNVFLVSPEPSHTAGTAMSMGPLTYGVELLDISDEPIAESVAADKEDEDDDEDEDQTRVIISSCSPKKKPNINIRNQNSWKISSNNGNANGRLRVAFSLPDKTGILSPPPGFQPRIRPSFFDHFSTSHVNRNQQNNSGPFRPRFPGNNFRSGFNPNHRPSFNPNQRPSFSPNHRPSFNPNHRTGFNPNYRPGFNPNHRPGFNSNQQKPQTHNIGLPRPHLGMQLAGAVKSMERPLFSKNIVNVLSSPNNYQPRNFRNFNSSNPSPRGGILTLSNNRSRENPIHDYYNEIMEEMEAEAPGRIVNLLVGLKPSAARKLNISNFGKSYYELRMRLPVSTPMSVVKRIFLAKFHMTMLLRVSIYSTDRNSEFYQDHSCVVMENENRRVLMNNTLDMNAFSIVTRKDGRFVSESETIYQILLHKPDMQDKTIYGGEIALLLT